MTTLINIAILTAVMAVTTYIVRMVPFVLFRRKIKSVFLRSLIHYLPYAILTAMTIPGIFYSTGDVKTALIGFAVALILAFYEKSLLLISLSASGAALLFWYIFSFLNI